MKTATDERLLATLARGWWIFLLRGLAAGALAGVLASLSVLSLHEAAWAAAGAVGLGSALDLALAWRLRHVMPRRTPRLTAAAGLVFGVAVVGLTATRGFLILVVGLWLGVRGLAALWAALSMDLRSRDWLLPLALAGLSGAFGGVLMFWTMLFSNAAALEALAAGYALCCVGLYAAAAWRMRTAPRRWILAPRQAAPPAEPAEMGRAGR